MNIFGSAAVWEVVPNADWIMALSYILPIIFCALWVILFAKVLIDKKQKKSNKKLTLVLFRLTTMFCLATIILELFFIIFRDWYDKQWILLVELLTPLAWFSFKRYPKNAILVSIVMLVLTLAISVPVAISNYDALHKNVVDLVDLEPELKTNKWSNEELDRELDGKQWIDCMPPLDNYQSQLCARAEEIDYPYIAY